MAPKRKTAQKQAKPSTEDMPPVIIEDMSHITVRRPLTKDNVIQKDENDTEVPISENNIDMNNVTTILEEIPEFKHKVTELESETDLVEDEAESIKKPVQKKVTKTKLKSKKITAEEDSKAVRTRKRAASEDRQVMKVEDKVVIKSRKRPVDKNLPESLKPVSLLIELPKRNRRAASVDILTSETKSSSDKVPKKNKVNSKSTKAAIIETEADALKKQKKGTKKDDQPKIIETKDEEKKILEKNSKGKKNTKKVLNEEKENVVTEQNEVEAVLNSNQEKPKSKRGIKKVKINEHVEDEDDEYKAEKVPKPSSRNRAMPKVMVKQNGENDLEKKQKNVPKTKKVVKSPEKSDESSEKNETDDSNKSPEIKPKRERKFKQNDHEQKDDDFKEIKARKRGGLKAKVEDFDEEVQQKSPPAEHEINHESENLADQSDTPELEKEEVKPIAAKRKTKAKSKK